MVIDPPSFVAFKQKNFKTSGQQFLVPYSSQGRLSRHPVNKAQRRSKTFEVCKNQHCRLKIKDGDKGVLEVSSRHRRGTTENTPVETNLDPRWVYWDLMG